MKLFGSIILFLSASLSYAADNAGDKWIVSQQNVTCLIVQMNIKVNFSYVTTDNSTKAASYQIPVNETTVDPSSACQGKEDSLDVSWNTYNNFSMKFVSNGSLYSLSSFVIYMNTSNLFNDSAANQSAVVKYENDKYDIPTNFSYHCNREQELNATNGFMIFVSKVQYEAFRSSANTRFSSALDCDSSIRPDIVPIAVGISLIALIVVVLIAYIVGRRRQQARGYLNI